MNWNYFKLFICWQTETFFILHLQNDICSISILLLQNVFPLVFDFLFCQNSFAEDGENPIPID